jgi:hypothetical protein
MKSDLPVMVGRKTSLGHAILQGLVHQGGQEPRDPQIPVARRRVH